MTFTNPRTASFVPEEKLILALDQMNQPEVFLLLKKLPSLIWVKVGLELFTLLGPEIIYKLRDLDKKIFLDLKFHDIPNTMGRACYRAAKMGVNLMTVHACAGKRGLEEANRLAIEGAMEVGLSPPSLLAVTVLTSWDSKDFVNELDIHQPIHKRVELLGALASSAGIAGCICSPLEVAKLRQDFPEPFQLITPGIRSQKINTDDQARVMTPAQALHSGASKLVVGREISQASDPEEAFNAICNQLVSN